MEIFFMKLLLYIIYKKNMKICEIISILRIKKCFKKINLMKNF